MKIGSYRGIDVHIHWTLWALMLFYFITAAPSAGIGGAMILVGFLVAVFGCVLLHEFGHSLTAAAFGIPTRDITLTPIGGVARLTRMPKDPTQELLIALAGPAVNVVIALVLGIPLLFGVEAGVSTPGLLQSWGLLELMVVINLSLVAFNMIPAFPMDGGRVLRSLIAYRTTHLRATEIAARVGRWFALAFAIYALVTWDFFPMLFIAGFIYISGTAELMSVRAQAGWRQQPLAGGSPFQAQQPFDATQSFGGAGFQDGPWANQNDHSSRSDEVIDAVSVRQIRDEDDQG